MSENLPTTPAPSGLLLPVATADQVLHAQDATAELIRDALKSGIDYGVIPGTNDKRATLLKPGAERLCIAFGVVADYEIVESEADHDRVNKISVKKWVDAKKPNDDRVNELKSAGRGKFRKGGSGEPNWVWQEATLEEGESYGLYKYLFKCTLRSRATNAIVGTGIGSCSSLESKYIRNPRDHENTIVKMAQKRALVSAALVTFGLSDRFTQDVEDHVELEPTQEEAPATKPAAKPEAPAQAKEPAAKATEVKRDGPEAFGFRVRKPNAQHFTTPATDVDREMLKSACDARGILGPGLLAPVAGELVPGAQNQPFEEWSKAVVGMLYDWVKNVESVSFLFTHQSEAPVDAEVVE